MKLAVLSSSPGQSRHDQPTAIPLMRPPAAAVPFLLIAAVFLTAGSIAATYLREPANPDLLMAAYYGASGMPMPSSWATARCHVPAANRSEMRLDRAELLALLAER